MIQLALRRVSPRSLPAPALLAVALLALLGSVSPRPLAAQEIALPAVSDTLYEARLVSGEGYVGRVVAVQGDTLTLLTTGGVRVQLLRAQIASLRPARGQERGSEFWPEDPNRTRLFFSPTGRTLEKGSGYFGVYELFIPFVAYGVTDRVMLVGGSPFYLAFLGDVAPPFYFGPKVQVVDGAKFDGSVGALAVFVPVSGSSDGGDNFGIVYGVGSYGDADNAVTAGMGFGYVGSDFSSRPVLMLGGEARTGRSIKLITENLVVPGEDGVLLSAGIRFFGERLSADAGLVGDAGSGGGCCLPVVNFVYNFGRR